MSGMPIRHLGLRYGGEVAGMTIERCDGAGAISVRFRSVVVGLLQRFFRLAGVVSACSLFLFPSDALAETQVAIVQVSADEFNAKLAGAGFMQGSTILAQAAVPSPEGTGSAQGMEQPFVQAAPAPPPKRTQFGGENRLFLNYNRVKGAQERSFLKRGLNFVEELDLQLNHVWENDVKFEGFLGGRLTDDPTVDTERASLQRFYLKFTGITFEATLGDAMANFSQYTVMRNLRGVSGFKDLALMEGLRVNFFAGVVVNRWEDLWKDPLNKTYMRYAEGLRLEQKISDSLSFTLNAATFKDDRGSLPDPQPGATASTTRPIENHVGSFEFFLRPSRDFRLEGEAATSWLDADTASSEAAKKSDQAYRLDTRFRLGPIRVGGGYNRIEPDFFTGGGFVQPDLEEYYAKAEADLASSFVIGAAYRDSWDNVKGQKEFRTKIRKPEGFFMFTGIPGVSLEGRVKDIHSTTSDGLSDFSTLTAGGSLSWQIGPARLSASYENRDKRDANDKSREGKGQLATSRLDFQFGGDKLSFSPHVGYDRETDKTAASKTTQQSAYCGFVFSVPSKADLEVSYRHWDADTNQAGQDTVRTEGKAEIRLYPFKDTSKLLSFAFIEKDYEYEKTAETQNKGYTERTVQGRFNYRF